MYFLIAKRDHKYIIQDFINSDLLISSFKLKLILSASLASQTLHQHVSTIVSLRLFVIPMNLKDGLVYFLSGQVFADEGDPRVTRFPLLSGGPSSMFIIMFSWLWFVKYLGPKLMRDRPAFELRGPMLVYNVFMVVANAYFLYEFVFIIKFGAALLDLNFPDRSDTSPQTIRALNVVYFYYLTKYVDLLDTIFFVLRKKYSQVCYELLILHL